VPVLHLTPQVASFRQRMRLIEQGRGKDRRPPLHNMGSLQSHVQSYVKTAQAGIRIGSFCLEQGWRMTERQTYMRVIHPPDDAFIQQDTPWRGGPLRRSRRP